MTREEAIKDLIELQKSRDMEAAHITADDILCRLLRSLGYADVVSAWEQLPKWYA